MAEPEAAELDIQVERGPASQVRIEARRQARPVAVIDIDAAADPTSVRVNLLTPLCGRDDVRALLHAIAAVTGRAFVSLDGSDVLLRYQARRAGLRGGLREPLTGVLAPTAGESHADPTRTPSAELLGRLVEAMVPGTVVRAGSVRGVVRWAWSGLPAMVDLAVGLPDGDRMVVRCGEAADVVPESLALAIDTVVSVRRRIPLAAGAVRTVSFDHSDHGFTASKYAGAAELNRAVIHLNASLAFASGLDVMARTRATDRQQRSPARVPPPATYIDGVTAHEMWHQIESALEARSYAETIEFRRSLGQSLGVDTLEQVVLGGRRGAKPAWRSAHDQLTAEVSSYAGTAPREATAEMFKLWWCCPPDAWSPLVRHFGDLIGRLCVS